MSFSGFVSTVAVDSLPEGVADAIFSRFFVGLDENTVGPPEPVPLPAGVWLLASALVGVRVFRGKHKSPNA
ncbi:MAG: hypothetical protein ACI8PT_000611 [Gammaproteobacteria bacterium]|jgi:hypothetical protein